MCHCVDLVLTRRRLCLAQSKLCLALTVAEQDRDSLKELFFFLISLNLSFVCKLIYKEWRNGGILRSRFFILFFSLLVCRFTEFGRDKMPFLFLLCCRFPKYEEIHFFVWAKTKTNCICTKFGWELVFWFAQSSALAQNNLTHTSFFLFGALLDFGAQGRRPGYPGPGPGLL